MVLWAQIVVSLLKVWMLLIPCLDKVNHKINFYNSTSTYQFAWDFRHASFKTTGITWWQVVAHTGRKWVLQPFNCETKFTEMSISNKMWTHEDVIRSTTLTRITRISVSVQLIPTKQASVTEKSHTKIHTTKQKNALYTEKNEKGGSTFVWKISIDFYNFCTVVSRKKVFTDVWKMSTSPKYCTSATLWKWNITFHILKMHS